jgi:hypothetical protein
MHTGWFWPIFIGFIFVFTSFVCGANYATTRIWNAAIKAKVAEYQVNKETGETKFIFLTPAEKDIK